MIQHNLSPDILELSSDSDSIQIKLILLHPQANIISHSMPFNQSLFQEISSRMYSWNHNNSTCLSEARKIGLTVYHLLFFDSMGKLLQGMNTVFSRKNTLSIFLHDQLANIPFELAFNGNHFASLTRCVSRNIGNHNIYNHNIYNHNICQHNLIEQEANSSNSRSLLIIADPALNSKTSYQEGAQIYNQLKKLSHPSLQRIDFFSKDLSKMEFLELLEQYDWLHFSGHGDYDKQNGNGLLIGKNTFISESDISSLTNPPEFIFLNACMTGRQNPQRRISLINKLLKLGVKNMIASNWLVLDQNYADFILQFYEHILSKESIGKSFTTVKTGNYSHQDHKWIYFNLYGNPDSVYG